MDIRENYNFWCTSPYFDEDTKAELRAIEGDENEIKERFCAESPFLSHNQGTGCPRSGPIQNGIGDVPPVSQFLLAVYLRIL